MNILSDKIQLNMLENGFDFILNSFDDLENDELKYTAIHLYSGVLLILKERLYHIDEKLIFEKPNKFNKQSLKNGNFQSVNYTTLLERLSDHSASISEEFKSELEWLRSERNKMEHFQVNVRVDALKSHIVNILVHFIPYIKTELVHNDLLDEYDEKLQLIISYLHQYEEYVQVKLTTIEKDEGIKKKIFDGLECPLCSQETVFIDGGEAYCYFCETKFNDFTETYINENFNLYEIIKDGGTDPCNECPDCSSESMIYLDHSLSYICLSCGVLYSHEQLEPCARCEVKLAYSNDPHEPAFCDYCLDFFKFN